MDLKELGLKFGLGYLMSRSTGTSQKTAVVDSLFGSLISQAKEDVTGFTPEIADVTQAVVADLVLGRETSLSDAKVNTEEKVKTFDKLIHDPEVGLTEKGVQEEIELLKQGIDEAVSTLSRLEQLQAGVLRRNT